MTSPLYVGIGIMVKPHVRLHLLVLEFNNLAPRDVGVTSSLYVGIEIMVKPHVGLHITENM